MKKPRISVLRFGLPVSVLGAVCWLTPAEPRVNDLIRQTNGEVLLTAAADAGATTGDETVLAVESEVGHGYCCSGTSPHAIDTTAATSLPMPTVTSARRASYM